MDNFNSWIASPVGKDAKGYISYCWVFPVHGIVDGKCTCGKYPCGENNKQAGKHPFTRHGVNDASNDIEQVARMFQYRTDLNLGLRTGEISGFFVIDVDGRSGGFASLDSMINTYGHLPETIIIETGNGVHLWFNYPSGDIKISNRTHIMPGIDVRGESGYVLAPNSRHVSGKIYTQTETSSDQTSDAPSWLLDLVITKKKKDIEPLKSDTISNVESDWSVEEVNRMLDSLDPDMGYQQWLEIGMALHAGGFNLSLWDSWSRSGEKYENGDCEKRWHGFNPAHGITMGTLVSMAQMNGWKPKPVEREIVDTSNIEPLVRKAKESLKKPAEKKETAKTLGFDAMALPGLIGDTVRWITKYALRKQPELALLNTLAFAGAVFGRRYASPLNTRTNIYSVGIASTGAGKEHSRKLIKELAHACGLDMKIGADDIRSDSGMLRSLMVNSSQIMMLDEFGHFLQAISNEKSPHYIRSQAKILLKLYSASNSIYNHGEYADVKSDPIIIQAPNLCIYGTSTEETYSKSLKKAAVESGELNRFVVIKSRTDKEYPDKVMPKYEIDASLQERWADFAAKFGDSLGVIINSSDVAPAPIAIEWGECDELQYAIQCRQVDKTDGNSPVRHLWGRLFENVVKIAMIFAITRNKDNPVFESSDFEIAQMIVESSIEYLTSLASNHMSETPQEESNHEIVNAIKDAGGSMGRRDIMRKFRKLKKRDLDDIIGGLIEQEVIEVEKVTEKGRPKTIYSLLKDEQSVAA